MNSVAAVRFWKREATVCLPFTSYAQILQKHNFSMRSKETLFTVEIRMSQRWIALQGELTSIYLTQGLNAGKVEMEAACREEYFRFFNEPCFPSRITNNRIKNTLKKVSTFQRWQRKLQACVVCLWCNLVDSIMYENAVKCTSYTFEEYFSIRGPQRRRRTTSK